MPYQYRKLTQEQREQILSIRKALGYPLHSPPHPIRDAGYYLLTAANYEHAPIMASPERRSEFQHKLITTYHEIQADIIGWVVLPNHYHILINVSSLEPVQMAIKHLHGATSYEWNISDNLSGKRRVWYKFTDRLLRNDTHLYKALNYIHYNPIKHGYVTNVYEWEWSSIYLYYEDFGRDWLRDKWQKYPTGNFGAGWDD